MFKKLLSIVLATILMLTFSVSALAQDTGSINALEQEHLQKLSLYRSDITSIKNGELRMPCSVCNAGGMKLLSRVANGTTICDRYPTSTGFKDKLYLYTYECANCGNTDEYENQVCTHSV